MVLSEVPRRAHTGSVHQCAQDEASDVDDSLSVEMLLSSVSFFLPLASRSSPPKHLEQYALKSFATIVDDSSKNSEWYQQAPVRCNLRKRVLRDTLTQNGVEMLKPSAA